MLNCLSGKGCSENGHFLACRVQIRTGIYSNVRRFHYCAHALDGLASLLMGVCFLIGCGCSFARGFCCQIAEMDARTK